VLRHAAPASTGTTDRLEKLAAPHAVTSATTEHSENSLSVQAPRLSDSDMLGATTVVQYIITDFSEAVSEKYDLYKNGT
jgi:hypothetical protein